MMIRNLINQPVSVPSFSGPDSVDLVTDADRIWKTARTLPGHQSKI